MLGGTKCLKLLIVKLKPYKRFPVVADLNWIVSLFSSIWVTYQWEQISAEQKNCDFSSAAHSW
jgi:hypothetical protein